MASPDVDVYAALTEALGSLGARWYVFGAQAAIIHGAVRFTEDIDVTVELGETPTKELLRVLRETGFAFRVDDVDDFVARTRALPCVHQATQTPVDVVLAGPGLEETFFERATSVEIENHSVPVASAEDIILMKVLAGRPKDLEDVVAMLAAQGGKLDLGYVRRTLRAVEDVLGQGDLTPLFEQCLSRIGPDSSP